MLTGGRDAVGVFVLVKGNIKEKPTQIYLIILRSHQILCQQE